MSAALRVGPPERAARHGLKDAAPSAPASFRGVKLRDVGEFGLIARVARRVARTRPHPAGVVLGMGDDAAILRPRRGEDVVVTTDAVVENVHFRWRTTPPRLVGARALVAAASDLGAMGARPLAVLASLVAPPRLALATLEGCLDGLVSEAARHGLPLVGGNVARGPVTSLTLTVLGAVTRGRALRRDRARPGDRLFVTGALGAAALDLARCEQRGAKARYRPAPRIEAGRALARLASVGACIDVSDGLLADLGHVLKASSVGAELDPDRVPVPPGFARACARLGQDPRRLALSGGEDYELLFTLRAGGPSAAALARRLGLPVSEIGRIVRGRGLRGLRQQGFTHF